MNYSIQPILKQALVWGEHENGLFIKSNHNTLSILTYDMGLLQADPLTDIEENI